MREEKFGKVYPENGKKLDDYRNNKSTTKYEKKLIIKLTILAKCHFLLAEVSKNNISHISKMKHNGYKKCKKKTVGAELKKFQTNGF